MAGHPGTDLQRAQIIKGWVDAEGATHERVHDVAGDANSGAAVDPENCAPTGAGFAALCAVWKDADFDPLQRAFYYLRVLENPTCRWSTLQCQAAGLNLVLAQERGAQGDVYGKCCLQAQDEPFYSPSIQERAWTSPIWYVPARTTAASTRYEASGASSGFVGSKVHR